VQSLDVCHNQAVLLSQLFQFAACFNGAMSWPTGIVVDAIGTSAVMRLFIVLGGAFFAVIGLWPAYGVSAQIGLLGFCVCAGGILIVTSSKILPVATRGCPDELDRWLLRVVASCFAGFAFGYPLGVFVGWPAIPFAWSCVIVAAIFAFVFKVWYERSVSALISDDEPRQPLRCTGCRFLCDRAVILGALAVGTAQALSSSFLSAVPRVAPFFGVDDPSAAATFVPLVGAVGSALVMVLTPAIEHVTEKASLRFAQLALRTAGLVGALALICVPAFAVPAAFWAAVLLVCFWSTSTFVAGFQLIAGEHLAGDAVRSGVFITIGNVISLAIGQPLTYALGQSDTSMRTLTACVGAIAFCTEVPMVFVAAKQFVANRDLGGSAATKNNEQQQLLVAHETANAAAP
jgi:hypothetical protein